MFRSPALKQSFPLLLTILTQKIGQIGISIIPVLLIEREISSQDSSQIMFAVRSAVFVGILFGGWISDRIGHRITLLFSYFLGAIALGGLPWATTAIVIGALGFLAQLSKAMGQPASRMLLTHLVDPQHQQEALGWGRTVNNLGQAFAFSIGAALGALGTNPLFWFDAATLLAALFLGLWLIPGKKVSGTAPKKSFKRAAHEIFTPSVHNLILCGLILAGWTLIDDLFMVGIAARLKILRPDAGLQMFSQIMILNTILCTAFAVIAARKLTRVIPTLATGTIITGVGLWVALNWIDSTWGVFAGAFLVSAGEVIFSAVSQFALIQVTPHGPHESSWYSTGLILQSLGRLAGSTLAFPLIVEHPDPSLWIAAATGLTLVPLFFLGRRSTV